MNTTGSDGAIPVVPLTNAGSIVYYVRRGQAIKIGTTINPVTRFTSLMPDEILAFEPGTVKEEKMRHRQFHHLRCWGEHFRPGPELLEHARELRQVHGDPDPAWPTVAILESRPPVPSREPGERYCSQHHRPRRTCSPDKRHVHALRCTDGLMAQVAATADAMGIDRNAAVETALREFVQAYGQGVTRVA